MNMNEFKKWFQKEKIKYLYRPINEIDCGVGWNAALKCLLVYLENHTDRGKDIVQVENHIKKELKNG